jgi:hypothetical protein
MSRRLIYKKQFCILFVGEANKIKKTKNNNKVRINILINILPSVALKVHLSTPLSAAIVGLPQADFS